MGKSDPEVKSFDISKRLVWEAYKSVKANDGAAGVNGQSIEEFETDLKNNLYRIWNRMSSGTYFPPPVRAVEIPKPHGGGTRILGIPTVGDRIAQTVVALQLLPRMEQGDSKIANRSHVVTVSDRTGRADGCAAAAAVP